jgi:hypothetical protein
MKDSIAINKPKIVNDTPLKADRLGAKTAPIDSTFVKIFLIIRN